MKRKYRSSFLLKGSYRENAKLFGLSINTYQLYIKRAVEYGFLVPEKNGYRAKSLFTIVKQFCWENGVQIHNHKLLSKKTLNFKKVLSNIETILYHDTLLVPQFKYVNLDQNKPECAKQASSNNIAGGKINGPREVTSSARHIQKKFGYGLQKAISIMKAKNSLYSYKFNFSFHKGCNKTNQIRLESEFPSATIILFKESDSIKVCFGTTMFCKRLNNVTTLHGKRLGVQQRILMAERLIKYSKGSQREDFNGFNQKQIESMMLPGREMKKSEFFRGILSRKWDVKASSRMLALEL